MTEHFCYILKSLHPNHQNLTYNGYTNDVVKRLNKHNTNKGAKATKGKGPWIPYVIITGFKTKHEALSCEWRIKKPTCTKTRPKEYCGIEGRINSLNIILNLDKWTSKKNIESENYTLYIDMNYIHLIKNIHTRFNVKDINEFTYL